MMDSDDQAVRLDTRLSGQVRRFHTWPILGEQTVSEHTWQILRIYMSVVNEIDPFIVFHITFHDIGETDSGDLPYPVKRDNPKLRAEVNVVEDRSWAAQLDFWDAIHHSKRPLTDEERAFMKLIEIIEMAEFGLDQLSLGNNHGYAVANRCLRWIFQKEPIQRVREYVAKRLNLFYQQNLKFIPPQAKWWYVNEWERLNVS